MRQIERHNSNVAFEVIGKIKHSLYQRSDFQQRVNVNFKVNRKHRSRNGKCEVKIYVQAVLGLMRPLEYLSFKFEHIL